MSDNSLNDGLVFAKVGGAGAQLVDIIFVHGIDGDPVKTWQCKNNEAFDDGYWPNWIVDDVPNCAVYTLGHPSSTWRKLGASEMSLSERAKGVLDYLCAFGIGKKPIAFVCHSLGGLIAKQILRTANDSEQEDWVEFRNATKFVAFIATPHHGSHLASQLASYGKIVSSKTLSLLTAENLGLEELGESYRAFANNGDCRTVAYYELHPVKGISQVVSPLSGDPGVAGCNPVPIEADHISICKPKDRHSPIYVGILNHLKKCVEKCSKELPASEGDLETSIDYDVQLGEHSGLDRRSLIEKLIDADREHIYSTANEYQNRFAQSYMRYGLHSPSKAKHDEVLSEIEQRFITHVYQPIICKGGSEASVTAAVQKWVVDPVADKIRARTPHASSFVLDALYFLTERCHIRWDHE